MNNKKTIIAIIVTIAVVIIGLGGYFGYGYYCKVNQTKQLNAKIEEFEKLSFDTDKDKKVNIYKELENDAKSYNKIEDAYNKALDKAEKGFEDYYANKLSTIKTDELTIESITKCLKDLSDLKDEIAKDGILANDNELLKSIDNKIKEFNNKKLETFLNEKCPSYKDLLLSDEDINKSSRSTLENNVSTLGNYNNLVSESELLDESQKKTFSDEVTPYIEKYNNKIEELKQQEEAEREKQRQQEEAKREKQKQKAQTSNNSSNNSNTTSQQSQPQQQNSGTYQGHVVPLPEIWEHINAGHEIYIGSGYWCCDTCEDANWYKGYQY